MRNRSLRSLAWSIAALALMFAGWHLLGRVDFPTVATADVPSGPTVLPVNEANQALQEGRQWAKTNGITHHRACKEGLGPGLRALGCHYHVTALKTIPPLERDGLTQPRTRDCVAAVRAHYDPRLQDMVEKGDHHAADSWQRRTVDPLVKQCNNIDNVRILGAVHEPLARLNAMLGQLRSGQTLSGADLTVLRREYPEVELFRDHPERTRYLASAQELFGLLGGREQVFPLALQGVARDDQCKALAQQVAALKKAFHESLESAAPDAQAANPVASRAANATSPEVARQDQLLAQWAQAEDARQKVGCPQLR